MIDEQVTASKSAERKAQSLDPWTGWRYPVILIALIVLSFRGLTEMFQGDFSWFRIASVLFYIGWGAWLVNKRRQQVSAKDRGA